MVITMFILKGILRAESQEKILLYLLVREKGYGKAIAEFFNRPANPIQKQLVRLEDEGVVVSRSIGQIREYELNPRYAFNKQLKELLKAALTAYPEKIRNTLAMERRRPRKAGKPINYVD
jgi:predicted transcriptional regulator